MTTAIVNIMSCVISYLLITVVSISRTLIPFSKIPDTILANSAICFAIGTIGAISVSLVFTSNFFSKFMIRFFQKTPNDNIWKDILDLKNGSNLKIYVKDQNYYVIGHHRNHEEKDGDCWLALSAFAKYDKETNKNYKNEPSYLEDENCIYTIRFSEIEHIEVF